jgi:hypothetical protein
VATHGQALATREGEFYAPSKLHSNDVNAALEDREIRDNWKALPISKRTASLEAMARGDNARLLEALTRSPVPLEDHEAALVQSAWRDAVARREPKKAAELQNSRANVEWADSVVKAAAQYSGRSSGLTPAEIAAAATGTGGEHLFTFGAAADHAA